MGQTIICEYLAEWGESNQQPDPRNHGFDGLYSMLEECQNVMFALGESANEKAVRIAELEERVLLFARRLNNSNVRAIEARRRATELESQLAAALATIEAAAVPVEKATGEDYAEG